MAAGRGGAGAPRRVAGNARGNGGFAWRFQVKRQPPSHFVAVVDDLNKDKFDNERARLEEVVRIAPGAITRGERCMQHGVAFYFDDAESLDRFNKSRFWSEGGPGEHAFGERAPGKPARVHPPSGKHDNAPRPTEKAESGKVKVYQVPHIGHEAIEHLRQQRVELAWTFKLLDG